MGSAESVRDLGWLALDTVELDNVDLFTRGVVAGRRLCVVSKRSERVKCKLQLSKRLVQCLTIVKHEGSFSRVAGICEDLQADGAIEVAKQRQLS